MNARIQFEEVVRENQEFVFRTLARLTGRGEHLEDLAQEVFLRLYRGLDQFRGDAKLKTWLYRITLNVAQDEWKRRKKEQMNTSFDNPEEGWAERISGGEGDAEEILTWKQSIDAVNQAMSELNETERAVVVMFHQEECTYEQIALILKLPLNTVRTHLYRGRQKLKERLQTWVMERKPKWGTQVQTR